MSSALVVFSWIFHQDQAQTLIPWPQGQERPPRCEEIDCTERGRCTGEDGRGDDMLADKDLREDNVPNTAPRGAHKKAPAEAGAQGHTDCSSGRHG